MADVKRLIDIFVHEAVQDVDEAFHVGHVEADGGFFDEVEVALEVLEAAQALGGGAALAGGEFGDEFEALGFAAAEGVMEQTTLGTLGSCNRLRSLRGRKIRGQYSGPFSI